MLSIPLALDQMNLCTVQVPNLSTLCNESPKNRRWNWLIRQNISVLCHGYNCPCLQNSCHKCVKNQIMHRKCTNELMHKTKQTLFPCSIASGLLNCTVHVEILMTAGSQNSTSKWIRMHDLNVIGIIRAYISEKDYWLEFHWKKTEKSPLASSH